MVKVKVINNKYVLELNDEEMKNLMSCTWHRWQKIKFPKELRKWADKFQTDTWGWNHVGNNEVLIKPKKGQADWNTERIGKTMFCDNVDCKGNSKVFFNVKLKKVFDYDECIWCGDCVETDNNMIETCKVIEK